jgi:hypothetical protein
MRLAIGLVLLGLTGCAAPQLAQSVCRAPTPPLPPPAGPREGHTRNVVLVTIDGARWQEMFRGVDPARAHSAGLPACAVVPSAELLPNLHRWFVRGGVAVGASDGAPMLASGPNFVSLPGYREILTGRSGARCTSNWCGPIEEPTLLDELRARDPSGVAVIASWERIERAAARDPSGIVLSAGRHHGATRDRLRVSAAASALLDAAVAAGASPGVLDYRADRYTAQLALRYLQAERPRFLFVGLGDTDERAHRNDYAGYLASLRAADAFLGELEATLARLGDYGADTTVLVTADHGRAASFRDHGGWAPESSRVWLFAAGGAVRAQGFAPGDRPTRLADIAPTIRRLLALPDDASPRAGTPLEAILGPAAGPILARRPAN